MFASSMIIKLIGQGITLEANKALAVLHCSGGSNRAGDSGGTIYAVFLPHRFWVSLARLYRGLRSGCRIFRPMHCLGLYLRTSVA